MNLDSILEKATKLGIRTFSANKFEQLQEVAHQLGFDNFDPTNDNIKKLDQMLSEMEANNSTETQDNPNDGVLNKNENKAVKNSYNGNQYNRKVKNSFNRDNPNKFRNFKKTINNLGQKQFNPLNKTSTTEQPNQSSNDTNQIKNNLNNVGQNVVSTLKEKSGNVAKKGLLNYAKKNPYVLLACGIILLIILIILILMISSSDGGDTGGMGYYDESCNYNEISVKLNVCNSNETINLSLEDYVIGTAYSYIKDGDYSQETIKALMLVLKTNALANGNYSSSKTSITINDCSMSYSAISDIDSIKLRILNETYSLVEEELFVSESYNDSIDSLSSYNLLKINMDVLNEMESLNNISYSSILDTIYNTENEEIIEVKDNSNIIFVGDSRIFYMNAYDIMNDENSVFAGAMGYEWFAGSKSTYYESHTYNCKTNAIYCVNEKIGAKNADIVLWLGVNDAGASDARGTWVFDDYYNKYYELATGEWKNHNIYVFSVGYVDENKTNIYENEYIDQFNNYMKDNINKSGLSNLTYIDLGYTIEEMMEGLPSNDGVHYTKAFSKKIYDNMISKIGGVSSISSKKKIYKMSDHCTYYNLTENDAYWWPIGSETPTEGNIYGGKPTSTYISSPYGPRTHPVNGYQGFHAAIDIAAGMQEVVIATKDGTVKSFYDGCTGIGDGCNGGAGNTLSIDHGDGVISRYFHLYPGSIVVKEGQSVKQGEKIALIGSTGTSTGPHLHFVINVNGSDVNPEDYVSAENPRPVTSPISSNVDDSASTPEETKKAMCKSLLAGGFSENAVAAMLVNVQHEGSFKTTNLEDCYEENKCCYGISGYPNGYGFCIHPEIKGFGSDTLYTQGVDSGAYPKDKFINDRAGYGLIQWTPSARKEGLYNYAKSENKSIGSLSVQLGYLLEELKQEQYATTYKYLTGNYSAYDITYYFCYNFEVPANRAATCKNRANNESANMLKYVQNGCSN